MKVLVFGATGGTGRETVIQALAAGHTVTAVVRRPEALDISHEKLTVLRGNVLDATAVLQPMAGQDVVISALGVRTNTPTTDCSGGVSNMLRAMQSTGVRRFLCVSANGLEPGPWWQKLFAKLILHRIFREAYADLWRMEAVVKQSDLEWTIVRPPMLTDAPRTGIYMEAINKHVPHGFRISRANVADYMLKHVADAATYRTTVEIAE